MMRSLMLLSCLGACATVPVPAPSQPANGRQTLRYNVQGVPVIQIIDSSLPTLRISWQFAQGADAEGDDEIGSNSLLASLMTRGAAGKDAMAMAEAVDNLGGSLSGSASRDSMRFTVGGLTRDTQVLSKLLAQTVRQPNLDKEEFERLRRQALAGMKSGRNRGQNLAQRALQKLMYGSDRLGIPISGDEDSLKALDLARIKARYAKIIQPRQLTIGVFGDAKPEEIKALLNEQLKDWAAGEAAKRPNEAKLVAKVRIHIVDKPDLTQVNVHLASKGVARSRADYETITLLNYALGGGGFSSRLMKLIRSERGLTYGIRSGFSSGERAGPFMITSFTRVEKVRELIDLSLQVVAEVAAHGITAQELADAKGYYLGSYPLSLETVEGEGDRLLYAARYGLGDDYIDAYPKRLAAVSLAQVKALAAELLHADKLLIVLAGPKDKLIESLKGLGEMRASWWEDDKPIDLLP
jgi:zinc protease